MRQLRLVRLLRPNALAPIKIRDPDVEQKTLAVLPYYGPVFSKIGMLANCFHLQAVFCPLNK